MKKIYKDYFQKSKVFLYPLLGIKKGIRYVPIETYIEWDQMNSPYTLYCLYKHPKKEEEKKMFDIFLDIHIKNKESFNEYFILSKKYTLCSFDLFSFKKDYKNFKDGKYSKFSTYAKNIIIEFFGKTGSISEYIESYLYPEYYYEHYSEILNVPVKDLKEVQELCDKPNIEKETFIKELAEIKLFK
jgi:hypothetical protein